MKSKLKQINLSKKNKEREVENLEDIVAQTNEIFEEDHRGNQIAASNSKCQCTGGCNCVGRCGK